MENRRTNNKEVDKTPYDSVIFNCDMPLLEVEANEMQDIILNKLSQIYKAIGNCVVGFTNVSINQDGKYIIPDGVMIIYNDHIINISGIEFDIAADSVDSIYINVENNVTYTDESTIQKYGIIDGKDTVITPTVENVDNNIKDDRVGRTTTARNGFKWWFTSTNEDGTADPVFSIDNGVMTVHSDMPSIKNIVGNDATLRDELNAKMEELGKHVSDGKSAVASAITEIGVSTDSDATFEEIVNNIYGIRDKYVEELKQELAKAGITVNDGETLQQAIDKISNITPVITEGNDGTGYHSTATVGDNSVRVDYNSGSGASAANVLSGVRFASSVAGRDIVGIMPNNGAQNITLSNMNGGTAISAGYHNGAGTAKCGCNNRGAVSQSLSRGGTSSYTVPQGYHNGAGKVSCGCTNRGSWGTTINPGGSVTVPAGYHSGGGVVRANAATGGKFYLDADIYAGLSGSAYSASTVMMFAAPFTGNMKVTVGTSTGSGTVQYHQINGTISQYGVTTNYVTEGSRIELSVKAINGSITYLRVKIEEV